MTSHPFPYTVSLENQYLSVRVMPNLGAKVSSLLDRRTGREWLLPSQFEDGGYRKPNFGADYSHFDTSGFDECFPTIAASTHPDSSIQWPDHGEIWSRPWMMEQSDNCVRTIIQGCHWPYTFTRQASLENDSLCLDYSLENHSKQAFQHIWSSHPLLKVTPGMRVLLPSTLDESSSNTLFESELLTVQPRSCRIAKKQFLRQVVEGFCGILDPDTGEALTLHWNPKEIPNLGLWLCYGGWPKDGRPGHLTVALEPCTGIPDSLQDAADQNACATLGPGERTSWSLRLRSHRELNPKNLFGETP